MNRAERIIAILEKALNPTRLELTDESHKHAGHAGSAPSGETHYDLTIEAEYFRGLSKVQRHQRIYQLLAHELKTGLHALAIKAWPPGEF